MKGTANYDALVLERLLKGERFVNSHGAKVKISQGANINRDSWTHGFWSGSSHQQTKDNPKADQTCKASSIRAWALKNCWFCCAI